MNKSVQDDTQVTLDQKEKQFVHLVRAFRCSSYVVSSEAESHLNYWKSFPFNPIFVFIDTYVFTILIYTFSHDNLGRGQLNVNLILVLKTGAGLYT